MTTEAKAKAITPIDEVRGALTKMQDQFKMVLPPQIAPERFARVAITAVNNNPDLLAADRKSLYSACMLAAQDGLLPDNREAALVIFGKQVVYMPMVGGILKKVRNSGELASIDTQVVYKNDKFVYRPGLDDVPEFQPDWFGDRGEPVGVYAVAKTKDGATYVEIMNMTQVDAVKKMARSKNVWDGPFKSEMWRKSAIRRLSKRLPMSTDLEQVIQRDDELYDLNKPTDEPKPAEAPTKPTRLGKIIEATATKVDPVTTTDAPVETTPTDAIEPSELPI